LGLWILGMLHADLHNVLYAVLHALLPHVLRAPLHGLLRSVRHDVRTLPSLWVPSGVCLAWFRMLRSSLRDRLLLHGH